MQQAAFHHSPDSYFSLSQNLTIDAPKADDIGTQIAKIPVIDVNKSNLTFFCLKTEKDDNTKHSSIQIDDISFPERQIVKFNFSDYKQGSAFGTLNDKDCALTLSLTAVQWSNSGLEEVVSSRVSSTDSSPGMDFETSRKIKLFVKRSEYKEFVRILTDRGLLLIHEHDNDECSSSASGLATLSSIKSRLSARQYQAHDHIEFSTRINDPEKLYHITHQLQALHQPYENDSHLSESVQASQFKEIEAAEVESKGEIQETLASQFIHQVDNTAHPPQSPSTQNDLGPKNPTISVSSKLQFTTYPSSCCKSNSNYEKKTH